jgi:hypothetical protein
MTATNQPPNNNPTAYPTPTPPKRASEFCCHQSPVRARRRDMVMIIAM